MEINTKQKEENYTSPELSVIVFGSSSLILQNSNEGVGDGGESQWPNG